MKNYCKVCHVAVPQKRVELGYPDSCVHHSNAFRYVSFVAGSNKSDYEISIVRDKETAEHMQHLLQTRGVL
jgi:hypothetical protein